VTPGQILGLLAALAFLPPLGFLLYIRMHEKHGREPLGPVLGIFLYGATVGIILALVLNTLFGWGFAGTAAERQLSGALLVAVIGAPIFEELSKGLGLGLARRHMEEVEDGIVYGAAAGLGFAATENLVYAYAGLADGGLGVAITTVIARIFSSMVLHAGTSALLGFGYSLMLVRQGVVFQLLPYYLLAVLFHAIYNFLVLRQGLLGFAAAVVMAIVLTTYLRRRLRHLDALPHSPAAVSRVL
jgi:RsiW-degrading membrane proteinase PrsW (M82 family)